MNLEKKASVSGVIKDLWKNTRELPKNFKEYNKIRKSIAQDILNNLDSKDSTFLIDELYNKQKAMFSHLKNISKGLVIPTAAGVGVGAGSYGGYRYLKNKQEKTAGLLSDTKNLIKNIKEYRKLTDSSYLPSDYFNHIKSIDKLKKSIMKGLIIPGVALGITGVGGTYIYKKTKQPANLKDY
jgi:hypothetical protein